MGPWINQVLSLQVLKEISSLYLSFLLVYKIKIVSRKLWGNSTLDNLGHLPPESLSSYPRKDSQITNLSLRLDTELNCTAGDISMILEKSANTVGFLLCHALPPCWEDLLFCLTLQTHAVCELDHCTFLRLISQYNAILHYLYLNSHTSSKQQRKCSVLSSLEC